MLLLLVNATFADRTTIFQWADASGILHTVSDTATFDAFVAAVLKVEIGAFTRLPAVTIAGPGTQEHEPMAQLPPLAQLPAGLFVFGLLGPAIALAQSVSVSGNRIGTPAITVVQPASVASGASLALSGTYAHDAPTGIQWSVNGGTTWYSATSPTISGGNWSFSIPGLGDSYYVVSVRLADRPGASATIATPVAVGAALYAAVPTRLVAGSSFTFPVLSTGGVNQLYTNWTSTPTYAWQAYYSGTAQTSFTTHAVQAPAAAGVHYITLSSPQVNASVTYTVTVTAASSPIISLDPYYGSGYPYAGSASVASPVAVTGEYGGGTPTALDYQWDTNGWQSNGTAIINGNGTFSLVIPAPTGLATRTKHNLHVAFHHTPSSESFSWNWNGVTMTP